MKTISLGGKKGWDKVALVDDEDFEWLSQYNWSLTSKGYAANGNPRIYMHRLILQTPKELDGDHIDGNPLNNQRSNLRNCTRQQNTWNKRGSGKSSKYKGVEWYKPRQKWIAKIRINGPQVYLGLFKSEVEAAKAYDKKAKEVQGSFARLNFEETIIGR